jgi:hypothetical protein
VVTGMSVAEGNQVHDQWSRGMLGRAVVRLHRYSQTYGIAIYIHVPNMESPRICRSMAARN